MTALNDHAVAEQLAVDAGKLLGSLRADLTFKGADQRTIKNAGDRESHVWLMEQLAELRPEDPVLSEEGRDNSHRLSSSRSWIIDPLHGTREYGEGPEGRDVLMPLAIAGEHP